MPLRGGPLCPPTFRKSLKSRSTALFYPGDYAADIRPHLVFPNPQHLPSQGSECPTNPPIPLLIPQNLGHPERRVRSWHGSVPWAAVPKAPVNKYGYSPARQYKIGGPGEPGARLNQESPSRLLKGTPKNQFRRSARSPDPRHKTAALRSRPNRRDGHASHFSFRRTSSMRSAFADRVRNSPYCACALLMRLS